MNGVAQAPASQEGTDKITSHATGPAFGLSTSTEATPPLSSRCTTLNPAWFTCRQMKQSCQDVPWRARFVLGNSSAMCCPCRMVMFGTSYGMWLFHGEREYRMTSPQYVFRSQAGFSQLVAYRLNKITGLPPPLHNNHLRHQTESRCKGHSRPSWHTEAALQEINLQCESGTAGHIAVLIMDMAIGADYFYLQQTGPWRPPDLA